MLQVEMNVEEHVRSILRSIGENPDREGLQKTPSRVVESLFFVNQENMQGVGGKIKKWEILVMLLFIVVNNDGQ